jgi:hypothetical protein
VLIKAAPGLLAILVVAACGASSTPSETLAPTTASESPASTAAPATPAPTAPAVTPTPSYDCLTTWQGPIAGQINDAISDSSVVVGSLGVVDVGSDGSSAPGDHFFVIAGRVVGPSQTYLHFIADESFINSGSGRLFAADSATRAATNLGNATSPVAAPPAAGSLADQCAEADYVP